VIQVYKKSSDAYDTGELTSEDGKIKSDGLAFYGKDKQAQYEKLYRTLSYNPDNFGTPRQIRLGLRLDY